MTNIELIARQAKEIAELKEIVSDYKSRQEEALMHLTCIGGPLNDNRDKYSREQLLPLFKIEALLQA